MKIERKHVEAAVVETAKVIDDVKTEAGGAVLGILMGDAEVPEVSGKDKGRDRTIEDFEQELGL